MNTDLPDSRLVQTKQWLINLRARAVSLPTPTNKFPSISLTIPESLQPITVFVTSRVFLFNFMVGFLLMAMVIVGKDIQGNSERLEAVDMQRQAVEHRLLQWERVVQAYPDYRDGYYEVAILQLQLGNKQAAYANIEKSIALDPDFAGGKEFVAKLTQ